MAARPVPLPERTHVHVGALVCTILHVDVHVFTYQTCLSGACNCPSRGSVLVVSLLQLCWTSLSCFPACVLLIWTPMLLPSLLTCFSLLFSKPSPLALCLLKPGRERAAGVSDGLRLAADRLGSGLRGFGKAISSPFKAPDGLSGTMRAVVQNAPRAIAGPLGSAAGAGRYVMLGARNALAPERRRNT